MKYLKAWCCSCKISLHFATLLASIYSPEKQMAWNMHRKIMITR